MKKRLLFLTAFLAVIFLFGLNWANSENKNSKRKRESKVNTRIDNINYWVRMAEKGYVPFNPDVKAPPAVFTGSSIKAFSVLSDDSPDVLLTEINSTQSENSVFVDPNNNSVVLNSNNSTPNPVGTTINGANDLYTSDYGETWDGEVEGVGGSNSGDPTTAIGLNGRWFINYISDSYGQGISYSDDNGQTWTKKTVAPIPGPDGMADKNHMTIDNNATSPYNGNIYVAWTNFGGPEEHEIALSYSSDNGETWSNDVEISSAVNAGSHNQGVNLSVGPNGEVYAVWAIYDNWPTDETAIGMNVSYDGGVTWGTAKRIITNIKGIRHSETSKNMRVNSFPSSAVDCSNGPDRGTIYVTWTNKGVPGINTGNDIDVYLIKSTDNGETWSDPIRVNQDPAGQGKQHYLPWICVDEYTGIVSLIFYDDRNVGGSQCEVFCANSDDGGETWEDFKVSDVAFTPTPVPGLATGYFGDYLGISASNGWVYPVWTDNRSGHALSYTSPYETNPLNRPYNLQGDVDFETGMASLIWNYDEAEGFDHFNIYRDGEFINSTSDTVFSETLPDYGYYTYSVTAAYTEDMESGFSVIDLQWGDAHISVSPLNIDEKIIIDSTKTKYLSVVNTGQLDLIYNSSTIINNGSKDLNSYCSASGGGDEYISKVTFGNIENTSGSSQYADYTNLSTDLEAGHSYEIIVENGNPYSSDQCAAWIDWNQNEIFDDGMITFEGSPGEGPYTAIITPPVDAKPGTTRLRIRLTWTGALEPCESTSYGEVEDYSVNVITWISLDPTTDTIQPGDTAKIAVKLDATDLAAGSYNATTTIYSNDPNLPEVVVPITMEVVPTDIDVSTDVLTENDTASICIGDSIQLMATPSGNFADPVYSWTSNPAGFTSNEQNPKLLPYSSAWYIVQMTNSTTSYVATDSIFVNVVPLPVVDLGQDTTLCGVTEFELDAGNSGNEFLWSTGETTQTVTVSGNGPAEFWVKVTNQTGCSSSDTIMLNFAAVPVVNLGPDTAICHNSEITLNAVVNSETSFLWSTGETTQSITINAEDYELESDNDFSCLVTNSDGCQSSDTVKVHIKDCAGIGEETSNVSLDIFPNPNRGLLNLKIETKTPETVNLKLVSLTGKVIFNMEKVNVKSLFTKQINISHLSDGVYTLIISGNNFVINKKVILSR